MKLVIQGIGLPGRTFCDPGGVPFENVHVGVQLRTKAEDLVPGDATEARWELEITTTIDVGGELDFRGPAVQGKRGERFVYLCWGNVDDYGTFHMFRRAKLMLNRVDRSLMRDAVERGPLGARIQLTDDRGQPRCARVDPPAITWFVGCK